MAQALVTAILLAVVPTAAEGLDVQKHFSGTLGGTLRVEADLLATASTVSGYYRYVHIGRPIPLSGRRDDEGVTELVEYGEGANRDATGTFRGTLNGAGTTFDGTWTSADGSKELPFRLRENVASAWSFEVIGLSDERLAWAELPDGPKATYGRAWVLPDKILHPGEHQFFLARFLGGREPEARFRAEADDYFRQYAEEMSAETMADEPWMYRSVEDRFRVMYNTRDLVVLQGDFYEYGGGAHGNYGSEYIVVDMQAMRVLGFDDIFRSAAREDIGALLTSTARLGHGLSPHASLQEAGFFVDALEATDNLYVSKAGVGFVYIPYEVAAYTAGMVEVFLPMNALRSYLEPGFRVPE